jgi:hypothetical protein
VQESLLAPRILFFTKTQLVWHCNHSVHEFRNCSVAITPSESSPKLLAALLVRPGQQLAKRAICAQVPKIIKDIFFPDPRRKKIVPPSLGYASVFYEPYHLVRARQIARPKRGIFSPGFVSINMWFMIIHHYATRDFTYASDKPVALSTLARAIAQVRKTPYLAGLWLEPDYIRRQLYWQLMPNSKDENNVGKSVACLGACRKEQPSEYIAPSWSWASVNCGVSLDFSDVLFLATYLFFASHSSIFTVLEWKCTTGADVFVRVMDGFLRTDARIASLRDIGAQVTCTKNKHADHYAITWNEATEKAMAKPEENEGNPTVFYGNSLGCSIVDDLADKILVVPLATTDPKYIHVSGINALAVKATAVLRPGFDTHLSLLICIDVPMRDGQRTLRRIGACSITFVGSLSDLGWFDGLTSSEFLMV